MAKPRSDKEVIIALGGPSALTAELDGYSEHAVTKWMNSKRGIPWKARVKVAKLAASKRIKLPANFAEERAA